MTQLDKRIEMYTIGEDTVIAHFLDEKIFDEQNIASLGHQLFWIIEELQKKNIVLNFSNVEYLSAAMFAKMITLNRMCQGVKGRLICCSIAPEVYEVFEITKLNKLFEVAATEQEALERLKAS